MGCSRFWLCSKGQGNARHQAPPWSSRRTHHQRIRGLIPVQDSSPGFQSRISVQDSSPVVQSCLLSGRPVSVFLAGLVPLSYICNTPACLFPSSNELTHPGHASSSRSTVRRAQWGSRRGVLLRPPAGVRQVVLQRSLPGSG